MAYKVCALAGSVYTPPSFNHSSHSLVSSASPVISLQTPRSYSFTPRKGLRIISCTFGKASTYWSTYCIQTASSGMGPMPSPDFTCHSPQCPRLPSCTQLKNPGLTSSNASAIFCNTLPCASIRSGLAQLGEYPLPYEVS